MNNAGFQGFPVIKSIERFDPAGDQSDKKSDSFSCKISEKCVGKLTVLGKCRCGTGGSVVICKYFI